MLAGNVALMYIGRTLIPMVIVGCIILIANGLLIMHKDCTFPVYEPGILKIDLGGDEYFFRKIISKLRNAGDDVKMREPCTFRDLEIIFLKIMCVTLRSIFRIPLLYAEKFDYWWVCICWLGLQPFVLCKEILDSARTWKVRCGIQVTWGAKGEE